ncbi:hypothetical protein ACA910_014120 [Epithemia clementina (nom. ined.)]
MELSQNHEQKDSLRSTTAIQQSNPSIVNLCGKYDSHLGGGGCYDSTNGLVELHESLQQNKYANGPTAFVVRLSFIAGLGGILFGYDLGVISAAFPYLTQDLGLKETEEEWVVSILYVGGFVGALVGGSVCDSVGRKNSILVTDVLFFLGALILFWAPSYGVVLCGRIVVGFAVALSGIADVCYLNEIAPTQWRGSVVSVNEACISLGFLLAFAAGSWFASADNSWRLLFGLSGGVAVVQFMGMWDMPESPKWLREHGRHLEYALAVSRICEEESVKTQQTLAKDFPSDWISTETNPRLQAGSKSETAAALANDESDCHGFTLTSNYVSFGAEETENRSRNILHVPIIQKPLMSAQKKGAFLAQYPRQFWVTFFLSVTQQLCGQTCVLSFAPEIFASLSRNNNNGASSYVHGWATIFIGLIKFLVTVLVIWKIDAFGRRPLLLSGMMAISSGLVLLILSAVVGRITDFEQVTGTENGPSDGDASLANDMRSLYIAIAGVMCVVCGYSMSFGPLTWLMTSELFPTEVRGRALGASTILSFGSAILVTSTFLTMQSAIGISAVFGCYLVVSILGVLFALTAVPETKEKNVEQIDMDLRHMLWWRRIYT